MYWKRFNLIGDSWSINIPSKSEWLVWLIINANMLKWVLTLISYLICLEQLILMIIINRLIIKMISNL